MSRSGLKLVTVLAVAVAVLALVAIACGSPSTAGRSAVATQAPTSIPARSTATETPARPATPAPTPRQGTTPRPKQSATPKPTQAASPKPTPAATPTPKPTATPTAVPTPEARPALGSGMVGLFLAVNGGSSSNLLRTVSTDSTSGEMAGSRYINIEKDAKAVVLYVPETGEATVIDSYTSPSYAPHTKRPVTVDDRLYVSTKYSTSLNYAEYDPQTLRTINNLKAKEEVLASQSQIQLKGARVEDPVTMISRKDPSGTGDSEVVAAFEVSDLDSYVQSSWWQMALDNDVVYWAAMSYEGQSLVGEVWSFRLDDPATDPLMHRFTVPDAPGEISMLLKFDVDDGHAVIQPRFRGTGDSHLILYDLNTGAVELVDTGLRIFDVQILHLGE